MTYQRCTKAGYWPGHGCGLAAGRLGEEVEGGLGCMRTAVFKFKQTSTVFTNEYCLYLGI